MKVKDLPLISVLGDAFKIPISDITSDRTLAVSLGQILSYVKEQTIDDRYHTVLLESTPFENLTAEQMNELTFYCELEEEEDDTPQTASASYDNTTGKMTVPDASFDSTTGRLTLPSASFSDGKLTLS